jgi:hypothetical protein
VSPPPVCLERGKLAAVVVTPRRVLSKQSLWGQVSVKLTPEICINNASSNSRLTAAGRWATASDSHSQTCLQTLFSSLPLMRQQLNYTCMLKNLLKLYCIWTWYTLWVFLFCVVLFSFVFLSFSTLWWDKNRTTSVTPSLGLEAEKLTPKLLRLKLYCIWTWSFYLFIYYFYFFYFLFSILSLSL